MAKQLLPTKPYKGTRDFYPEDMRLRNWFFGKMREVVEGYGYEEYGGPIVEALDLYAAKSGEELVNEQIYHFSDKGDRRLAIRPEVTPSLARMVAARLERLPFPLRWYTIANLMRYERPQKGRLREHWQLNVDIFGEPGVRADLEIVSIVVDLLRAFGADESAFKVRLSNRRLFNDVLTGLLEVGESEIHAISKAVDKRAKIAPEDYENWLLESGLPSEKIQRLDEIFATPLANLCEQLGNDSRGAREMAELFQLLEDAGLATYCEFDFSVVRGFDYYTGTVFEVYDTSPENRRALFGGGRYDDLVGLFKKSDLSGIGFGFGDVTFQHFIEIHRLVPPDLWRGCKALVAAFPDVPYAEYLRLAAELREGGVATSVYLDPGAKLKKQLAFAEKAGFPAVLILGAREAADGTVAIRRMATREQETVSRKSCVRRVREILEA